MDGNPDPLRSGIFERMDVTLYDGSERGIFEQFIGLAGVSDYTDRYYIDLCVVYVLFSHEVFQEIFRCFSFLCLCIAQCMRIMLWQCRGHAFDCVFVSMLEGLQ